MKFGAFIMTYNRPDVLRTTLSTLALQTVRPELILVIDNSEQQSARQVILEYDSASVLYHPMNCNTGPAGAASFGLQWFKEKGYDWIYWGDDDNPPEIPNTFERIFRMIDAVGGSVGVAAAVGQKFNFSKGTVLRLEDKELKGYLDVDVMSGPSYMIVNMLAINEQTLPDPRLFFGFEEFEFALKVKRSGFRLLVDGDLMRDYRIKYGRMNLKFHSRLVRDGASLWREYYSVRNVIYIFYRVYPEYRHIALYRIFAALGKIVVGFRYGITLGLRNAKYQCLAVVHGLTGKLGFRISPK